MNAEFIYRPANIEPRAQQQVQLPIGFAPANTELALRPLEYKVLPLKAASAHEHYDKVKSGDYEFNGARFNRDAYRVRKKLADRKAGLVTKVKHWYKSGLRGEAAVAEAKRFVDTYKVLEINHVAKTRDPIVDYQLRAAGIERRPLVVNHEKHSLVGGVVVKDDKRVVPTQELQAQLIKTSNQFSALMDECTATVADTGDGLTKVLNVDLNLIRPKIDRMLVNKSEKNPKGHPINKEDATILERVVRSMSLTNLAAAIKDKKIERVTEVTPDMRNPLPKLDGPIQRNILEAIKTEWRAPLNSFHPVSVSTGCNTMTDDQGCQATLGSYKDRAKFVIPRRSDFKRYKALRYIYADGPLTYYLKCKYFMKRRDAAVIQQMVADARLYLLKAGNAMDNDNDYDIMNRSVMAAYFIDDAELEFRARMKNPDNYDSLLHHNKTLEGDLGLVFSPLGQPGEKYSSRIKKATGLWKSVKLAKQQA